MRPVHTSSADFGEREAQALAHDLKDPLHTAIGHLGIIREAAEDTLDALGDLKTEVTRPHGRD